MGVVLSSFLNIWRVLRKFLLTPCVPNLGGIVAAGLAPAPERHSFDRLRTGPTRLRQTGRMYPAPLFRGN